MNITFYHSGLCPRCARARKHLASLLGDGYRGCVREVDIIAHPLRAFRDGIRMIPALACGTDRLSGLTLGREQIEQFLVTNNLLTAPGEDGR